MSNMCPLIISFCCQGLFLITWQIQDIWKIQKSKMVLSLCWYCHLQFAYSQQSSIYCFVQATHYEEKASRELCQETQPDWGVGHMKSLPMLFKYDRQLYTWKWILCLSESQDTDIDFYIMQKHNQLYKLTQNWNSLNIACSYILHSLFSALCFIPQNTEQWAGVKHSLIIVISLQLENKHFQMIEENLQLLEWSFCSSLVTNSPQKLHKFQSLFTSFYSVRNKN